MTNGNDMSYVIGLQTPIGFVYKVNGDNVSAFTKKDCEYRIRRLCNAGVISKENRDYLLLSLKQLKRPAKKK